MQPVRGAGACQLLSPLLFLWLLMQLNRLIPHLSSKHTHAPCALYLQADAAQELALTAGVRWFQTVFEGFDQSASPITTSPSFYAAGSLSGPSLVNGNGGSGNGNGMLSNGVSRGWPATGPTAGTGAAAGSILHYRIGNLLASGAKAYDGTALRTGPAVG